MRLARPLLVVGFGNPLMADDGVGCAVLGRLRLSGLSEGVRAEEGGDDSLRLRAIWGGEPEVWLVDALSAGAAPGTIHRLGHEALFAMRQQYVSAHQLSLPESLRWLNLAYPEMRCVRYRMWGIEPERLAMGERLTAAVMRAAIAVTREIRRFLRTA